MPIGFFNHCLFIFIYFCYFPISFENRHSVVFVIQLDVVLYIINIMRSLKKLYISVKTYIKLNERGIVTFLFSNPPLPNSLVYRLILGWLAGWMQIGDKGNCRIVCVSLNHNLLFLYSL
jgi:hypothetical protein